MNEPQRKAPATRVLAALCSAPWAMTAPALARMVEIANRENATVEAVEAQLGRPLDNSHAVTVRDGVATIPVLGPIVRYADMFSQISGATSTQSLATDFTAALANPAVNAILFEIDSPGGEANGIAEFADMIYDARGQKPTVAYIGGEGCSAAYWIASACDEVVASRTAIVGSIGVIAAIPTPDPKSKEIEFVSSQSPNKRLDPTSEVGRSAIQTLIDHIADEFVGAVATYRGVSEDTVLSDYGQGGVFVGTHAQDAGLVDRLSSQEALIASLSPSSQSGGKSRLAATATVHPITSTRSTRMNWRDLLTNQAQASGEELDFSDLDALPAGAASADDVETLKRDRASLLSQLEALKAEQATQAAALAQATEDRRAADAIGYAEKLVARGTILPASATHLAMLATRISALEDGQAVPEGADSTAQLFASFINSLPTDAHAVLTQQRVDASDGAGVVITPTRTAGVEGGSPRTYTQAEIDAQLALTPTGRAAIQARQAGN